MDPDSHHFIAAQGYFELGMFGDAREQLAQLPAEERAAPAVLHLRIHLDIAADKWSDALAVCRQLLDIAPDDASGHIHGAYCLHELGRTAEARELLLAGPEALRSEAIFFYNLGCYEARIGGIEPARDWLLRSFEMDDSLRRQAGRDPDLAEIWEDLQKALDES